MFSFKKILTSIYSGLNPNLSILYSLFLIKRDKEWSDIFCYSITNFVQNNLILINIPSYKKKISHSSFLTSMFSSFNPNLNFTSFWILTSTLISSLCNYCKIRMQYISIEPKSFFFAFPELMAVYANWNRIAICIFSFAFCCFFQHRVHKIPPENNEKNPKKISSLILCTSS